jgi:acetylornithine aminotransferase
LGLISNIFATAPQIALAEKLESLLTTEQPVKAFFTNSGSEANETAFKLTRLTGRKRIIAAQGSFHGRTSAAVAMTWTEKYRLPFEPLPGEISWVPYGDVDALAAAVDDTVAAVILEPIQGESGVIIPPDGYLKAAREITQRHGALLWLDEVQSGIGRTGYWFAHHHEGITPDIVTVAKALGNGFPMGACLAVGAAGELLTPGSHGSTYGGNPLAAHIGLTVLSEIEPLLPHVVETGTWLADQLRTLPGVVEVRQRGLFIGVDLDREIAPAFMQAGLHHGIVMNAPRPSTIRLVPPLIITRDDLGQLLETWPTLYSEASQ